MLPDSEERQKSYVSREQALHVRLQLKLVTHTLLSVQKHQFFTLSMGTGGNARKSGIK